MRALPLAAALSLAAATAGCETFGPATCDRSDAGNAEVTYTDGTVDGGVYMSAAWDGEQLFFPGGMHYALAHKLGITPRWWQAYLTFDQLGTQNGGTFAQAAGNQVVVTSMTDTEIHVVNDSCVEYWLLVTAGTGAPP